MARSAPSFRTALSAVVAASVMALVTGCNAPGQPPARVGALPYPGLFTLYEVADPQRLGRHGARGWIGGGADRGIVYTKEAGFLDVAHVRDTIDWTHYSARHVRAAIGRGEPTLALRMKNLTWFHLRFNYPADWPAMPDDERRAVADELSVQVGQELAYLMMTWHEVLTWHGYRATLVVDEAPSAFSYDDILSHLVGIIVAGEAMRQVGIDEQDAFDLAVTDVLDEAMRELDAVPPAETQRAVAAVKGKWWDGGRPLRRQLDVGLEDGALRPWLVPGVSGPRRPRAFDIPRLGSVRGRDFSGFYAVEIDSRAAVTEHIRLGVPGRPVRFVPERDLAPVIAQIRRELEADGQVVAAKR